MTVGGGLLFGQAPRTWTIGMPTPFQELEEQNMPTAFSMAAGDVPEMMFDPTHVAVAVESLYNDQLKPYGRILRKRVAERMHESGLEVDDVDASRLKSVCEATEGLLVEPEGGGDWCAFIVGRMPNFIDVYSPDDRYPEWMWSAAAAYFNTLGKLRRPEMSLPGGRYSCARALASRGIPWLQGRSLGEVCHIVQLAISQKKLLGYSNGTVVPYAYSQSRQKERCADRRKPCASTGRSAGLWPLATWDSVRAVLREIFCTNTSAQALPISDIKRLFRKRFHLELSETALGHSKLSELLQDWRLVDICTVKLQGHGYIATPSWLEGAGCGNSLAHVLEAPYPTMFPWGAFSSDALVPPAADPRYHALQANANLYASTFCESDFFISAVSSDYKFDGVDQLPALQSWSEQTALPIKAEFLKVPIQESTMPACSVKATPITSVATSSDYMLFSTPSTTAPSTPPSTPPPGLAMPQKCCVQGVQAAVAATSLNRCIRRAGSSDLDCDTVISGSPGYQRFCPHEQFLFDNLEEGLPAGKASEEQVSRQLFMSRIGGAHNGDNSDDTLAVQPRVKRGPRLPPRWIDDDVCLRAHKDTSNVELRVPAPTSSPAYYCDVSNVVVSPCRRLVEAAEYAVRRIEVAD